MLLHQRINARASEAKHRAQAQRYSFGPADYAVKLATYAAMPLARYGHNIEPRDSGAYNRAHEGWRWIERADRLGLRVVLVNDVRDSGIRHKGWYTFPDGDPSDTIQGAIVRLPARKGRNRYMLGYSDAWNPNCYRVENELHEATLDDSGEGEDMRGLCRAADSLAEHAAEEERDYRAADQELRTLREKASEASSAVSEALEELREYRATGLANPNEYQKAIEALDEAWEAYRKAQSNAVDHARYAKRHYQISWDDCAP